MTVAVQRGKSRSERLRSRAQKESRHSPILGKLSHAPLARRLMTATVQSVSNRTTYVPIRDLFIGFGLLIPD